MNEFKIGDRVKVVPLGIVGRIYYEYPLSDGCLSGKYEVMEDGTGRRYIAAGPMIEPESHKRPFQCCECIHFELCRGMFGNAGKLPCDFDDYFEAREGAKNGPEYDP